MIFSSRMLHRDLMPVCKGRPRLLWHTVCIAWLAGVGDSHFAGPVPVRAQACFLFLQDACMLVASRYITV